MPSINFKGKNAVWNHHLSVPYQTLEKDNNLSVKGKNEDENLIIEGDNLIALKSLLPKYQGRIKCIYIDPPYNIGNENWVYNDNVNSPLIKDWIKKAVGVDDLARHDKWLCMMAPRLKLLLELLSNDGVIFVSIDDNEVFRLKQLMDEIFKEENFIANFVWKKKSGGAADVGNVATDHEYILLYSKTDQPKMFLDKEAKVTTVYNLVDEKGNKYGLDRLDKQSLGYQASLDFPIKGPDGKTYRVEHKDPQNKVARWRWSKDTVEERYEELVFKWPYVYTKNYEKDAFIPRSLLTEERFGRTRTGKTELKHLFGKVGIFEHPKPSKLIKHLLSISTEKEDIVLDSFAGSGTTAHATISLNREDHNNRKFILVQLPEEIAKETIAYKTGFRYVHEITRERVKRVIEKDKLKVGFSHMRLGPQIDAESILSGSLPTYKEFAKYTYYLATGRTMDNDKSINEKDYYVGKVDGISIYLLYEKNKEKLQCLAVTLEWAEKIHKKDKSKKVVYAPACFLDEEYLEKFNIQFVGIPYSLFEKK
jgi:adenine-specific DNA-methyltransferase